MSSARLFGIGDSCGSRTRSLDSLGTHYGCVHLCSVTCLEVSIYVTDFISHLSKLYSLIDPKKEEGALLDCHSLVTETRQGVNTWGFTLGGLGNSVPRTAGVVFGRWLTQKSSVICGLSIHTGTLVTTV